MHMLNTCKKLFLYLVYILRNFVDKLYRQFENKLDQSQDIVTGNGYICPVKHLLKMHSQQTAVYMYQ